MLIILIIYVKKIIIILIFINNIFKKFQKKLVRKIFFSLNIVINFIYIKFLNKLTYIQSVEKIPMENLKLSQK